MPDIHMRGGQMTRCDNCLNDIETGEQTHLQIVKPTEYKGERQDITQYFCSVECLVETVET